MSKKTEKEVAPVREEENPCSGCAECMGCDEDELMTDYFIQEFHDTVVESMGAVDHHVSCLLGSACHELGNKELQKHVADQIREAARIFRVNIKKQQELAAICDKYAHFCENGTCPCITVYQNVLMNDSVVWMHRDDKMAMGQGDTFAEALQVAEKDLAGNKEPPKPTEIN